ncbi:MAG: MFS transporter, partial [bacterium]
IGVGLFGGIGPLGLAMATSLAPRDQTGRAVGSIQAAQILSAAIGPLTGGFLAGTVGIRRTFLLTALLCAAALALVVFYYEQAPPRESEPGEQAMPLRRILALDGVLALLWVLFLVNFVGKSFTPILPLYLQRLSVPREQLASATGLLISLYSIAAAFSAAWLGRTSRRVAPSRLLVGSLGLGAVVVLSMAFVPSFSLLLVLAVALGLASGGALTLCYTMGGLMVPGEHRTVAFGFFSMAALLGGAVSPSVAGLLVSWDLRGIYYLDTLIFLGVALALLPSAVRSPAPVLGEGRA